MAHLRWWVLVREKAVILLLGLLILVACVPVHASAFELFGIKLFGSDDEAEEAGIVDPVPYTTNLVMTQEDSELRGKLKDASLLVSMEKVPPSGLIGLIARARDDQANLIAKLYEEARYGGVVSIFIDGKRLETISFTERVPQNAGKIPVTITIDPGPQFRFGSIRVEGGDPRGAAVKADLVRGEFASSRTILAAETAIVRAWQKEGHPYATISGREVVADHATRTVDVSISVLPGQLARLGRTIVVGAQDVDADFLARQADIPEGEIYSPDILEKSRKNLAKLNALASVSIRVADEPDRDGVVPVIIEVSERKFRTIGAGATYSSTEGAGAEAYWLHRNLFGQAETLKVAAEVGRVFEASHWDQYDASFSVLFGKPGIWGPDTRLDLRAVVLQEDPDPYYRRGVVLEALVSREMTDYLTLTAGLSYDWARTDDAFGWHDYSTISVPLIAKYDSRDSILDPTSGIFARLIGEPQFELTSDSVFLKGDSELRLYKALDDDGKIVLAARGLAGSIFGADIVEIPPHRRFYAGGAGSVRGYAYLNVGPRIEGYGATGGLARVEGSFEARIKATNTIGLVPFVDVGLVTEDSDFTGNEEFAVGVGLGLRYFTSVGPLRLDLAVPLEPRPSDPDFAVYVGIGQAF